MGSDSFASSFNTGFQIGHQMEQDRRLEQVAQVQNQLHMMQIQKMAQELQQQAQERDLFKPTQQTVQTQPTVQDKYGVAPGLQNLAPTITQNVASPNTQAFLSQYPEKTQPIVQKLLEMGADWKTIESKFPKNPIQDKYMNVAEGGTIIKPSTGEVVYQGTPKDNLGYHIEKEQIGGKKAQDYRVFVDKQGNVVKRDPVGQPYTNAEGISNVRVQAFTNIPTSTPGISFNRANGKWLETDANGVQRALSSAEVKGRNLQYKEETPTSDIRVMQQSVPSVLQLIGQSRSAMDQTINSLGPAASRWRDLWSGKIGTADPSFRKLQTDVNLLQTRLMKMHVGARGGEYIMKHFQEIINSSKDSPENMKAALSEIESYANEVGQSIVNPNSVSPGGGKRKYRITKIGD